MLVDVHCHLDDEKFKDVGKVVFNARQKGVVAIVNQGISPESNKKTLELAYQFPIVKAALGLYPVNALKMSDGEVQRAIEFVRRNAKNIVCIGEVGLDNHWIKDKLEKQKPILKDFMKIAIDNNLPASIHSRDAELETIEFLEQFDYKKIIIHCFGGDVELVKRIKKNRWYVSIPASIMYDSHFADVVINMPLSHILTETDAPYLAPVKGQINVPENVTYTIKKIAEIKLMDAKEVENIIFNNYQTLF